VYVTLIHSHKLVFWIDVGIWGLTQACTGSASAVRFDYNAVLIQYSYIVPQVEVGLECTKWAATPPPPLATGSCIHSFHDCCRFSRFYSYSVECVINNISQLTNLCKTLAAAILLTSSTHFGARLGAFFY